MADLHIFGYTALLVGFIAVLRQLFSHAGNAAIKAPIVGTRSSLFARYEFYKNAATLLQTGYDNVSVELKCLPHTLTPANFASSKIRSSNSRVKIYSFYRENM
jgi:hypothetical protein